MNLLHDIPMNLTEKGTVNAVIEVPVRCRTKYEYSAQYGAMKFSRLLPIGFAFNYGFIPQTWADDHDPLDIAVFLDNELHPGTYAEVQVVAALPIVDKHGEDLKVISYPVKHPYTYGVDDMVHTVRDFYLKRVELEGKELTIGEPITDITTIINKIKEAHGEYLTIRSNHAWG